ncbi:hypothetical protein JRQ81_011574 [Phrynocephalus forsythii]|uniref:NACHT domain-containing protein n=1 Tax=Phrynocephalus forsythii TaxID=171643 RepID=A0A9Q0X702_9SAUR|nr:hypothetical protein JRQ81_011574 [Phrynocephalus forsythii]
MAAPLDCSRLIQEHRAQLLHWIEPSPAPLLRRLWDCGLLTQPEYFSLLETSPRTNQVIALLDNVSGKSEHSRRFLEALRELSEVYCAELQQWLQEHYPEEEKVGIHLTQPDPSPRPSKRSLLKFWKAKKYKFPTSSSENEEQVNRLSFRRGLSRQVRAALQSHRRSLLTRTEKLCTNVDDTESCGHIEIRYTDLLLSDNPRSVSASHDYLGLASRRARLYSFHAPRRMALSQLVSPIPEGSTPPLRVMLSGAAGIGKSVAAQKILHDWALGAAFQSFLCILDFSFRELSLVTTPMSLEDLIRNKHAHLSGVLPEVLDRPGEILVILDGLDEFRPPLKSKSSCTCSDQPVHIKDLVYGLLYRTLLPEATIVVTSRPSANLPEDTFDRHVVILGFQEDHTKEYFFRFFRDPERAAAVYGYISGHDSLVSLIFIPLYCFILCTALGEFFPCAGVKEASPPSTITEVYRQYLCTILRLHKPPSARPNGALESTKDLALQLGKLAYAATLRNQAIFYGDELQSFGFDPLNLPGTFLNRIFFKEDQVYGFFHLTIQEFLAALYAVITLDPNAQELMTCLDLWWEGSDQEEGGVGRDLLLANGPADGLLGYTRKFLSGPQQWDHLQMFSRFFMGLLTSRMEGKLKGMAGGLTGDPLIPLADWLGRKVQYESDRKLLSLLHCLAELRQEEVTRRAAAKLDEVDLFKVTLNPADCAALAYVLGCSEKKQLRNLNISYSNLGIRGLRRLQGLLHRCQTLQLRYNSLDQEAAVIEAAILRSPQCQVKRLLFCGNCLGSEGVRRLWDALQHNATLEELYLDITGITDSGLDNILDSLTGNTTLRLLTIVGNRLSDAGREILSELRRRKPELKIISSFLSDMGLLQAYLDWVEEIKVDPEQMESVKNADALRSVLEVLVETDDPGASREACERATQLKTQITALLAREDKTRGNGTL